LTAREQAVLQHTQLKALRFQLAPAAAAVVTAAPTSPAAVANVQEVAQLQRAVDRALPSRRWWQLDLQADVRAVRVAGLTLRHHPEQEGGSGAAAQSLNELDVRVLHDHVLIGPDASRRALALELDQSLQWLLDSIGHGSAYPVIGLDAESDCKASSEGEVRLMQLATGTRCLLIRIPPQRDVLAFLHKYGSPTPGQPGPLFTPNFHALMRNRAVFKAGAELWTDALG
jgi:hypothetical protein